MKYALAIVLLLLFVNGSYAQEPLHNFGNLKVHDGGAVGFHYDLVNDGITDDNQGLVGFFNNESTIISGAFSPIFKDVEIMVAGNLFLEVGVGVTNNTNFVLGDVITPRNNTDITLEYINDAFYNGDDDARKVDGYAGFTNKQDFIFPIGNENRLRSLQINSLEVIPNAKSAYFFENPNNPSVITASFDTSVKTSLLSAISTLEFWRLEAEVSSWINLSWDEESQLSTFVEDISKLKVVGWHIERQIWESLGGLDISGDIDNGQITSAIFLPNDYAAITFGSSIDSQDLNLGNYFVSANEDGVNDFLEFDAIEISPSNELQIYNRWGALVYSKTNYDNSFNGIANSGTIINEGRVLPAGVYFYIMNLKDIDRAHQGYFYITE